MASPKRNANRRKFNRQPLDIDDLTSASSFSGIRDVIESHFGKSDSDPAEGGGAEAARNVEPDPARPQFVWEPKGVPFSVRLGVDAIEKMEKASLEIFRAITSRGSEIGGILLGHVLPGWPTSIVVEQFEPIACAYTLGPSYILSEEEQEKLDEALEKHKGPEGLTVVGFFRSNTRPTLILQDEDQELFDEFFDEDHQVFILAKPYSRKPCQGAIFVREGGKIRTETSPLEFAFSRAELEKLGSLQPGLWPSNQPARVGPASTSERSAAIPIDSVAAEPKRPAPAPAAVKPEPAPAPPPEPVAAKPEPPAAPAPPPVATRPPVPVIRGERPVLPVRTPPAPEPPPPEPKVEPKAQPPIEQKIEARLPWLRQTTSTPVARPTAPKAEGPTSAPPKPSPFFTPPARVESRVAPPPAPVAPPPEVQPAPAPVEPPVSSAPAAPARPLFRPPQRVDPPTPEAEAPVTPPPPARPVRSLFGGPSRFESRVPPPSPPPPAAPAAAPPAAPAVTPPAESRAAAPAPASPRPSFFTPPARTDQTAAPAPDKPAPPRFTTRIQPRIPSQGQPGAGAGTFQPPRFMTRVESRTAAPQPPKAAPKPEAKTETVAAPKVERPAAPKPPVRIEPAVVRPPAPAPPPRAEVKTEPKVEPRTELKPEPKPEPKAEAKPDVTVAAPPPRFTKIQPRAQVTQQPEAHASDADEELKSAIRRKPDTSSAPSFGYEEQDSESGGWRRWVLPAVIALVIAVAGVYFFIIRPSRAAEETPAAVQAPAHRPAIALTLRVEGSEEGLTIFWDGLAAPMANAQRGLLSIRDGAATKNIDLTQDELKKGTYLYKKPRTDDVLVRLELKGLPGGQLANGEQRVLGARRLGKSN